MLFIWSVFHDILPYSMESVIIKVIMCPDGASQVVLVVKNLPANAGNVGRCGVHPWVRKIPWRREWQPTPVFLPVEFHGQRSLVGCSPWGCKESDTTERLSMHTCSVSWLLGQFLCVHIVLVWLLFKKLFAYLFIFSCAMSLLPHGLFSSCSKWGLLSSCGADFSLQWPLL